MLYKVATASLATSEIAWPIRYLLRDRPMSRPLFANSQWRRRGGQERVLLDAAMRCPMTR